MKYATQLPEDSTTMTRPLIESLDKEDVEHLRRSLEGLGTARQQPSIFSNRARMFVNGGHLRAYPGRLRQFSDSDLRQLCAGRMPCMSE